MVATSKKSRRPRTGRPKPEVVSWQTRFTRWFSLGKLYAAFALVVLLTTTLYWATKSAHLQLSNADQLVNAYLFEHASTLHNAFFPSAHSLLLKWPLFWLVKLLGFTAAAFTNLTVVSVLLTLAALVFIMWRIERRPFVFGTLCLALTSALLLVPAQSYAGALLPVNMAMLTTRNLEYILYIAVLVLFIRWPKLTDWRFWLGVAGLGLLGASDKLLLIFSLGGALLALVTFALVSNWKLVRLAVHWFVGSLLAGLGAFSLLALVQLSKLTHFTSQSTGSYGLIHNLHDIVLGSIYAVMGLLTNFGANPAYDATILRNIPHQLTSRLLGIGGAAFIINLLIVVGGTYALLRLVVPLLMPHQRPARNYSTATQLSLLLTFTTVAAVFVFIFSNHYYAVDARYLGIALFTFAIAAATFTRQRQWSVQQVVSVGVVITAGLVFGLASARQTYQADTTALASTNARNGLIAEALERRSTALLVGDYWRVLPVKFASNSRLQVMPLASCTVPRQDLSSAVWQPNLNNHHFAYLLSLEKGLTDYPQCTLPQIVAAYGRPNASVLIAGSLKQPQELLLFFDNGAHKNSPLNKSPAQGPATVLPISLQALPYTPCSVPTVMTIVAHQDDDLLFMNPDILHNIKAGYCMRTIYVTAGDSGSNKFYWLGREQGSEAAYSTMLGVSDIWIQRIVELTPGEFVTIANPRGNAKISLIFMHLPDGNVGGQGFPASNFESLARLEGGQIGTINSVDGQSGYSYTQLVSALNTFMHFFQPTEIYTQANYVSKHYPDHSDHMAVGRYVKKAFAQYELEQYADAVTIPLKFYIGYPVHAMPQNVFGKDLQQKSAAYLAYAKYDDHACNTIMQCENASTFGLYLEREYQNSN